MNQPGINISGCSCRRLGKWIELEGKGPGQRILGQLILCRVVISNLNKGKSNRNGITTLAYTYYMLWFVGIQKHK